MVNSQLSSNKEITITEKEEFERKKEQKEVEDKEFYKKWKPILKHIDEIKNVDPKLIDNSEYLMPIVDILIDQEIRIGLIQLRRYLFLEQEFGP